MMTITVACGKKRPKDRFLKIFTGSLMRKMHDIDDIQCF